MELIGLFFVALVGVGLYTFWSMRNNRQEKRLRDIGNNLLDPGSWRVLNQAEGMGMPHYFLEGTLRGRKVRYAENTDHAAFVIECGDVVDVDRAAEIQEQVRHQLQADSAKFYANTVFNKTVLLADAVRPYQKGFQVWKPITPSNWTLATIQDCFRVLLSSTPQPEPKE